MTDIPKIDSYEIAGEFVRKLAMNEIPEPAPGDLKTALLNNSVIVPSDMTATLDRDPADTFNIMIRNEAAIRAEWEAISDPGGISRISPGIEEIYKHYIENKALYEGPTADNIARRQRLFRARLADYTFGTCGG